MDRETSASLGDAVKLRQSRARNPQLAAPSVQEAVHALQEISATLRGFFVHSRKCIEEKAMCVPENVELNQPLAIAWVILLLELKNAQQQRALRTALQPALPVRMLS